MSVTPLLIVLFYQSLLCFAGNNPQTPSLHFPDDYPTLDNNQPRKWLFGFGAINTIAAVVTALLTLLNVLVYKLRELQELNFREKYNGLSLLSSENICRQFSLGEILLATNYFDESLVIGRGGFGKVYKGAINDGATIAAIKRLGYMSKQGANEFRTEITTLSKCRHSNLVSLIGYCETSNEMILVYEYIVHGTIADHLYKIRENGGSYVHLGWLQWLKICIGAARGLDYLHSGTGIKERVIHRDVKTSNILLDENWAARISDFGLSKIGPANRSFTHVSTNVKGTAGYLDPEYFCTNRLTRKSDVYAFGVVLFEVLSGRRAIDKRLDESQRSLARWARYCVKEGIYESIVNPSLKWEIFSESLAVFVKIAHKCLHDSHKERPTMSEVVAELEFSLTLQERRADSLAEEDIFGNNAAFDCQEIAESSTKEPLVVAVEGSGIKVDNGDHVDKKVGRAVDVGKMNFTKKLRTFFLVSNRRISRNGAVDHATEATPSDQNNFAGNDAVDYAVEATPSDQNNLVGNDAVDHATEATPSDQNDVAGKDTVDHATEVAQTDQNDRLLVAIEPILVSPIQLDESKKITQNFSGDAFVGSLHDILHGRKGVIGAQPGPSPVLSWSQRVKIAVGAAKGIQYLHETAQPHIVHRGIKSSNVLVYDNDVAKIADIDLSYQVARTVKLSHATRFIGTFGYQAPEYAMTGQLSSKTDVFSFGVVLLELLTGRKAVDYTLPHEPESLVAWSRPKLNEDRVQQCVDPRLNGEYPPKAVAKMAALAALCVQSEADNRPNMSIVLKVLQSLVAKQH